MSIANIVDSLNLSKEAGSRVTQVLKSTVAGNQEVIVNPVANEVEPDKILEGWDSVFDTNKTKCNSILTEIENKQRGKFGPRSLAIPWEDRKASLYDSFSKESEIPNLNVTAQGANRLRPLSPKQALEFLKDGTSAGLPSLSKKRDIKPSLQSITLDFLRNCDFYACMLFTRTQEQLKTRNVWGYAILLTLYEMMFYRPILEIQRRMTWRSALVTPDAVSQAITKLINLSKSTESLLLSIDFSSYDNTVKKKLQGYAFDYIKSFYQTSFHFDLDRIAGLFNTIGIVTPDGIISGPHGVPSGSTFTNEVDSIVQFLIASQSESGVKHVNLSQIQGDDGVYIVDSAIDVINFFRRFGLNVNEDKCFVSSDYAVYLQSLYHVDYVDEKGIINGIYPTYRALNRIIYPERFENFVKYDISGRDYFAIRTIAILENCKHHPLFNELVIYVAKLDKYNLKFSDQGLASFVKRLADKEGKDLTFKEWTYGSDVKGLKSFETYKLLREYWVK